MKKTGLGIILILYLLGSLSADSKLADYLKAAARNNPDLKVKFNRYHAALKQVVIKGALPDPQVMFGYFTSPIETRLGSQRGKISLSQQFPWFGTLKLKKDKAARLARAKYQELIDSKLIRFARNSRGSGKTGSG